MAHTASGRRGVGRGFVGGPDGIEPGDFVAQNGLGFTTVPDRSRGHVTRLNARLSSSNAAQALLPCLLQQQPPLGPPSLPAPAAAAGPHLPFLLQPCCSTILPCLLQQPPLRPSSIASCNSRRSALLPCLLQQQPLPSPPSLPQPAAATGPLLPCLCSPPLLVQPRCSAPPPLPAPAYNKGEMIRNENDTVQQANTYSIAHKQSRENATTVDNGLQSYRASNEPHNFDK
ncbi:hypothetical protein E2562_024689 [Oryza meyeriana var. granulata]|uniref:Uncharacterized protein n=1 Tax=Oryza meyeriana var. granulata TaxID=110450 RepID=A0A6G1EBL1_9ORYZ|nr:hypothetical protein E2562_024689 [Oryza meyeriana var. granulata]